jgi:hypothetical protein
MAHESPDVLKERLADARAIIALSSLWRHYKGDTYCVKGYAIDEGTDQVGVTYTPVDDPELEFYRPLSTWQDIVELHGETVPRFVPIQE